MKTIEWILVDRVGHNPIRISFESKEIESNLKSTFANPFHLIRIRIQKNWIADPVKYIYHFKSRNYI